MLSMKGLFIGRFQPFHNGHLEAIRFALKQVEILWIVIGSAQRSHEQRNPFTAGERLSMIRDTLLNTEIDPRRWYAIPLYDATHHYIWSRELDMLVPEYDVVFTNDPITTILFKEIGKEVIGVELKDRDNLSGTEIRRRIASNEEWRHLVSKETAMIIDKKSDRLRVIL
ncbi:MAG: nicotinamide-nucleotide adenylyltransferase [Candidatus Nitrosocaldaceae archaeon]